MLMQFNKPWVSLCCLEYGVPCHMLIQYPQQQPVSAFECWQDHCIHAKYCQGTLIHTIQNVLHGSVCAFLGTFTYMQVTIVTYKTNNVQCSVAHTFATSSEQPQFDTSVFSLAYLLLDSVYRDGRSRHDFMIGCYCSKGCHLIGNVTQMVRLKL